MIINSKKSRNLFLGLTGSSFDLDNMSGFIFSKTENGNLNIYDYRILKLVVYEFLKKVDGKPNSSIKTVEITINKESGLTHRDIDDPIENLKKIKFGEYSKKSNDIAIEGVSKEEGKYKFKFKGRVADYLRKLIHHEKIFSFFQYTYIDDNFIFDRKQKSVYLSIVLDHLRLNSNIYRTYYNKKNKEIEKTINDSFINNRKHICKIIKIMNNMYHGNEKTANQHKDTIKRLKKIMRNYILKGYSIEKKEFFENLKNKKYA